MQRSIHTPEDTEILFGDSAGRGAMGHAWTQMIFLGDLHDAILEQNFTWQLSTRFDIRHKNMAFVGIEDEYRKW